MVTMFQTRELYLIFLALFQVERNLYIRLIHNFFLSLQNYRIKAK